MENKNGIIAEESRKLVLELFISRMGVANKAGERPLSVVALKRFKEFIRETHPPGVTERSFANFQALDQHSKVLDGARSEKRMKELEEMVTAKTIDEPGKQELANAKLAQSFLDEAKDATSTLLHQLYSADELKIAQLTIADQGKTITSQQRNELERLQAQQKTRVGIEPELINAMFTPDENNRFHTGEIITGLFADARFDKPGDFGKALQEVDVLRANPNIINFLTEDRDTLNTILTASLENQQDLINYFAKDPSLLTPQERGIMAMLNKYKNMFGGALAIAFLGGAQGMMDYSVEPIDTGGQGRTR